MSPFEQEANQVCLSYAYLAASYMRRTPCERSKKLDHHTSQGIVLGFTEPAGNIYYRDLSTGNIKIGMCIFFDEAHMTSTSRRASLAAEALQQLGYHVRESWIDINVKTEYKADVNHSLLFKRLTPTATIPI